MIEIRIPNEIKNYKERAYFNLTYRQLISLLIALLINIPLWFFAKDYVNEQLLSWIILIIACVFAGIGFFKYNNMYLERFLYTYIKFKFNNQKRLYKVNNFYEFCVNKNKEGKENDINIKKRERKQKK